MGESRGRTPFPDRLLSNDNLVLDASIARLVLDNGAESRVPGTFQDLQDDRFGALDLSR